MTREYDEGRDGVNMFAKLHHHQQQQHHLQQLHHQHLQASRECQTSEEDDSRSSGGRASGGASTSIITKNIKTTEGISGDGASIEVVKRPRGRPPGSKNKPKPPLIITRETECAMRPLVLEVPGGVDVVESIARFARRRNIGVSVLTASGTVANVTLRQPSTTPGATVTFHGRFDILSITATYLPPSMSSSSLPSSVNGFTISLAGPQGQIVGGIVAGSLLAAGTVFVVAASFTSPTYHRLPVEDEAPDSIGHSPPTTSGGGDGGHPPSAESCGMSLYSCHLPSDVIWAPTARPTQTPPSRPPF